MRFVLVKVLIFNKLRKKMELTYSFLFFTSLKIGQLNQCYETSIILKPPISIGGSSKPTNAIYLLFKNITYITCEM